MALDTLHRQRDEMTASLLFLSDSINELSGATHRAESGHELAYSANARIVLMRDKTRKEQEQSVCDTNIVSQKGRLRIVETERRLVGKLKDRSYSDWSAGVSRELEETSSDLFLGGWKRR